MNLKKVPDRTVEDIRSLVENQIQNFASPAVVAGIQSFLIAPRLEMRTWDWNKAQATYPIWIVAESSKFDYGIAFSDYGFAPEHPWGLVFSSHSNFDADYCWYSTLEQAYTESRLIEEYSERQQDG
jgi:hypothetical protein